MDCQQWKSQMPLTKEMAIEQSEVLSLARLSLTWGLYIALQPVFDWQTRMWNPVRSKKLVKKSLYSVQEPQQLHEKVCSVHGLRTNTFPLNRAMCDRSWRTSSGRVALAVVQLMESWIARNRSLFSRIASAMACVWCGGTMACMGTPKTVAVICQCWW